MKDLKHFTDDVKCGEKINCCLISVDSLQKIWVQPVRSAEAMTIVQEKILAAETDPVPYKYDNFHIYESSLYLKNRNILEKLILISLFLFLSLFLSFIFKRLYRVFFYGSIIERCYEQLKLSTYVFLQVIVHPSDIFMALPHLLFCLD